MKERLNNLTQTIIGAAIVVHHALGPGMLESAYEACLTFELLDRALLVGAKRLYRSFIAAIRSTADIGSTLWLKDWS
jgi:GxxExxY protein